MTQVQFLAWRSIVARANVAHAAITDIEALDDGEAKRTRALNEAATHFAMLDLRDADSRRVSALWRVD